MTGARRARRWLLRSLGLAGLTLPAGCYVSRQAYHQTALFLSRQPIDEAIADPSLGVKERAALRYTEDLLRYASEQGLATAGAYEYYVHTDEAAVSYLVEAAYPDRLEALSWWFPVVGRVPYLGYFSRAERDAEAAKLRAAGYDVELGAAAAFSSLGWFSDPLYTPMLRHAPESFAALIFHELTHRSLWLAGYTSFNENLAAFCEGKLAASYLEARGRSEELAHLKQRQADKALYKSWLSELKTSLEALYNHPPPGGTELLYQKKAEIFAQFTGPRRPRFALHDLVGSGPWNNASVVGASLYSPDTARFAKAYACSQAKRVGDFLGAIEQRWKKGGYSDPLKALDSLCTSP